MSEADKLNDFHMWLAAKNPKIQTCIEMFKSIDKFIEYKLQTIKMLEDSKNSMDSHFAEIIVKNFPEAK